MFFNLILRWIHNAFSLFLSLLWVLFAVLRLKRLVIIIIIIIIIYDDDDDDYYYYYYLSLIY
jgi:general stress protein CsbA